MKNNLQHSLDQLVNKDQDGSSLNVIHGAIDYDRVGLDYLSGQSLFIEKNVIIAAGRKVGLEGLSGSDSETDG